MSRAVSSFIAGWGEPMPAYHYIRPEIQTVKGVNVIVDREHYRQMTDIEKQVASGIMRWLMRDELGWLVTVIENHNRMKHAPGHSGQAADDWTVMVDELGETMEKNIWLHRGILIDESLYDAIEDLWYMAVMRAGYMLTEGTFATPIERDIEGDL